MKLLLTFIVLTLAIRAVAMDRWTALAMIESANRDNAVGSVGEITRYQIRPELWPGGNPLDARAALVIAQRIMTGRIAAFQQTHRRLPNDFEFYVLWNAPAQINHPHRAVVERAERFVNLMADKDKSPAPAPIAAATPTVALTASPSPAKPAL